MQGKEHVPTEATRREVQAHALAGTPQELIAEILQITDKTLRKHYRAELDHALARANATIATTLYGRAKGGDVASMIFWLKTQAGWKETQRIEGDIGVNVTDERTPDEIRDSILGKLAAMSAASGSKEVS